MSWPWKIELWTIISTLYLFSQTFSRGTGTWDAPPPAINRFRPPSLYRVKSYLTVVFLFHGFMGLTVILLVMFCMRNLIFPFFQVYGWRGAYQTVPGGPFLYIYIYIPKVVIFVSLLVCLGVRSYLMNPWTVFDWGKSVEHRECF